MDIKMTIKKHKDVILYLFFGVCTTVVNVVSYWIFSHAFHAEVIVSTVAAWIFAVLFAYVTNRKWVFHSGAVRKDEIAKELFSFFGCRLATGVLDLLCMVIFVDLLKLSDMIIKIAANILVIILNYAASRLLIFKRRKQ